MIGFDTYIKMGKPGGKERAEAWKTAIGLQAVDGLKTSEYLNETAAKHIEGKITMEEVTQRINEHYGHNKLYSSTYEIVPPDSEMIQQIKEENKLRRPKMYEQDSAI